MSENLGYNMKITDYGYGKKQIKVFKNNVGHKVPREDGFTIDRRPWHEKLQDCDTQLEFENTLFKMDHSGRSSSSRTKQKVLHLARANRFDYFITLTFDQKKVDRYNYDEVSKNMVNWLKVQRRNNKDLKYILVPEKHVDGAWHIHGLISGYDESKLKYSGYNCIGKRSFKSTEDSSKGRPIYNMSKYKFGWNSATKIEDGQKVAFYIIKYLTKELLNHTNGKKRYWASRNLKKPTEETMSLNTEETKNLLDSLQTTADYKKLDVEINHPGYENSVSIFEISIT